MKHFKTRIIGIALAVSMLFGGTSVLAAPEADLSNMGNAPQISFNQTVHVSLESSEGGELYKFVPNSTMTYSIISFNNNNPYIDTYVKVYDSTGHKCGEIDDGANDNCNFQLDIKLTAGETYYIFATKLSSNASGDYDFRVFPLIRQYYEIDGDKYFDSEIYYTPGSNTSITMGMEISEDEGYTFQWYRYCDSGFETISGATTSTCAVSGPYSEYLIRYSTDGYVGTKYFYVYGDNYGKYITVDGEEYDDDEVDMEYGSDSVVAFHVDLQDNTGVSYQWQRLSIFSGQYIDISGATSSSYTVNCEGSAFRVLVSDNTISIPVEFSIDWSGRELSVSGIVQSLGNSGEETSAFIPSVTGTDNEVRFLAAPMYYQWLSQQNGTQMFNITDLRWSTGNTVPVWGFNATTLDMVTGSEEFIAPHMYGPFMGPMTTELISFVRSDDNSAEIALNDPQQVVLNPVVRAENDYPGIMAMYGVPGSMLSECMVYSYTPEASGTYTITSSNRDLGDPYVAIFDQDYGFVACGDNMDGSFFWDAAQEEAEEPAAETEIDQNFTLTQHLNGGTTYYFVVWSVPSFQKTPVPYYYMGAAKPGTQYKTDDGDEDATASVITGQFTVTLTCDELDTFAVTVTSNGHGSASASPTSGTYGTAVTLTATPDSGYRFTSWEVVSGGVTINNNRFTIGNANVEIRANFEAIPTPAPSTPTPTIPPANNNDSTSEGGVAGFVERLYTIALGRASDPAGKQDWIDAITLRGETGAGAARGFLYSPEFLNKNVTNEEFVATLYRTFFDREPDQAGFNAWVEVLNNGGSKEEVIEGFINSTEWANLCLFYGIRNGGTGVPSIEIEPNQATIDFATRLYTTCLGRNADQAGLMAWARQLANQRDTGTGAAHGFFFSAEFANQNVDNREFVTRLYRTFMNREPDQAGFDAWVAQLDAGVSREEVFNGFAQSIEFARICALYGIVR